jgi:hypothetical protein
MVSKNSTPSGYHTSLSVFEAIHAVCKCNTNMPEVRVLVFQ